VREKLIYIFYLSTTIWVLLGKAREMIYMGGT